MVDENLEKVRDTYANVEKLKAFISRLEDISLRADRVTTVLKKAEFYNGMPLKEVPKYFQRWILGGFDPEKLVYTENSPYNFVSFINWNHPWPNLQELFNESSEIKRYPNRVYDQKFIVNIGGIGAMIKDYSKRDLGVKLDECAKTFVEDMEEIVKSCMLFSPLYSPESFFLLSLRHLPMFYIEEVYPGFIDSEAYNILDLKTIFKGPTEKYDIIGPKPNGRLYTMIHILINLCKNVNSAGYYDDIKNIFFPWLRRTWSEWYDRKIRILNRAIEGKPEFYKFSDKLKKEYYKKAKIIEINGNYATIRINKNFDVVSADGKVTQKIDYPLLLSYAAPQWFLGMGDFHVENEEIGVFKVYLLE